MCLIALAWRVNEAYPLLLAANRDEFHARPTRAACWWDEPEGLFAGQDLRSGGTWCGVDVNGRFAAVTNVREPEAPAAPCSRGALVADYFATDSDAETWAHQVADNGQCYAPFNLLIGDRNRLWFVSNRDTVRMRPLPPGIWTVSNGHWGERWPKTERAAQNMRRCRVAEDGDREGLFELLADTEPAADAALPDTGIGLARERWLSAPFIRGTHYGTRASTVIRCSAEGCLDFEERGFAPGARAMHRVYQSWLIDGSL